MPHRGSFHEVQGLPLRRTAIALAIPPCAMSLLLVWQVVLGHPWGTQPLSNANVIGWTVFLWAVYLRLMTVRLVTDVSEREVIVNLRGLWRARRVPLGEISAVERTSFDPERDYGGYGIRSIREGKAYIASGKSGVRLRLGDGSVVIVGSRRAEELTAAIEAARRKVDPSLRSG